MKFTALVEAPLARGYRFDVMDEGAKLDGSDDTEAFERAIDKAKDYTAEKQLAAEVYSPPGAAFIRRPLFGHSKLIMSGGGKYATELRGNGGSGPNFIYGADRSSGSSVPQYATMTGPATGRAMIQGIRGAAQHVLDLTQYGGCRLFGEWSLSWTFGNTTRFAAGGGEPVSELLFIGGQLYPGQPFYSSPLHVTINDVGDVAIQFRHGNVVTNLPFRTASRPKFVIGALDNMEVSFNPATRELRAYWNGELWTQGTWIAPVGDGTGFKHYPWERLCLGSGPPFVLSSDGAFTWYLPSAIRNIHVSRVVRHHTDYLPDYGNVVPDVYTRLAVNFDRFFKGCVIGTGLDGIDVYLYPGCAARTEMPQTHLRDISFVDGAGIRSEFASRAHVENILHLYPRDGWQMLNNGYFSRFSNIEVVGSVGRAAWCMNGDSYCGMYDIRAAGPIGFLMDGVNVEGGNLTATIHPGYYVGMVMASGTNRAHFQVDAEEVDPEYMAALVISDPEAVRFDSATLYGPPGNTTSPAVIASMVNPDGRLKFDCCSFYQNPGAPIIQTVGSPVNLAHPIVLDTCKNALHAPLCNVPGNVVER